MFELPRGNYVSPFDAEASYYRFTLQHVKFEVPYTKEMIEFGAPWTYLLTFGTALAFVTFVCLIAKHLKPNSKPFAKSFEFWHYFGLFVYSAFICGATAYLMFDRGEWTDYQGFLCNTPPDWYRVLSFTFAVSKMWEWLDTMFLVWNGREISFLHFYHHMTTFFLFLYTINTPASDKLGMLLNGFVHTLMYYHYAFRLPKPFRPLITIAQIIQLFLGTISQHLAVMRCQHTALYYDEAPFDFHIPYFFVPVYLVAFVHFFYVAYIAPPKPAAKTAAEQQKKVD